MLKRWPIVLIAVAAASCNVPRGNNVSADQDEGSAANLAVSEANVAEINDAASNSAGNASAGDASAGNASAGNASAASGAGHASADSGAAYRAAGTGPDWSMTFGGQQMRYAPAQGAPVSEELPARTPIANGYRYAGARMTVEVVHRTCQGAGRATYPDAVRVTVGGRTLQGCGGGRSGERA